MDINDRVKVTIQNRHRYTVGCAESLNGQIGTIANYTASPPEGQRFLVNFDTPANPWWSGQLLVSSFWIPVNDLTPNG